MTNRQEYKAHVLFDEDDADYCAWYYMYISEVVLLLPEFCDESIGTWYIFTPSLRTMGGGAFGPPKWRWGSCLLRHSSCPQALQFYLGVYVGLWREFHCDIDGPIVPHIYRGNARAVARLRQYQRRGQNSLL